MKIISDVEQGTPEWLALHLGIVTCSELDTLLVNGRVRQVWVQVHSPTWIR